MKKIIILVFAILFCITAKAQEYEWEITKDTSEYSDCGFPFRICFIKGNIFENHEEGYWTTQKGDSLLKVLIDNSYNRDINKYYTAVVCQDFGAKYLNDFSDFNVYNFNLRQYYTIYYVSNYYYYNNKLYFIYNKISLRLELVENLNGGLDINGPAIDWHANTFSSEFDDYKENRKDKNGKLIEIQKIIKL